MTSNGIIRTIRLLFAFVTIMMTSCSIYDEYPHRMQYDVVLRVADSTGQVLPDSVASVTTLYAFKNGVYYGKYTTEADGKIHIVFRDDDSITFVAATGGRLGEYDMMEPQVGETINNLFFQLHTDIDSVSSAPSAIYYGSLSTTVKDDNLADERIIYLKDMRAKARVYVRGLRSRHGLGNYRVVLKGLHSGITYKGEPGGTYVSYSLPGKFVTQDDWVTQPAIVLPTGSEPVRLMIYKQDGTLILDSKVDENGKPLFIHSGDDIVFYVVVDYILDTTIRVLPFDEINNSFTFE